MVKVYVDSSELVHRAEAVLNGRTWEVPIGQVRHLVSSEVSAVEVGRVLMREQEPARIPRLVAVALATIDGVPPSSTVLALAASLPLRHLNSLDAIHLSTALITRCDLVLTRDRQMARACEELGLQVA